MTPRNSAQRRASRRVGATDRIAAGERPLGPQRRPARSVAASPPAPGKIPEPHRVIVSPSPGPVPWSNATIQTLAPCRSGSPTGTPSEESQSRTTPPRRRLRWSPSAERQVSDRPHACRLSDPPGRQALPRVQTPSARGRGHLPSGGNRRRRPAVVVQGRHRPTGRAVPEPGGLIAARARQIRPSAERFTRGSRGACRCHVAAGRLTSQSRTHAVEPPVASMRPSRPNRRQ